MKPRRFLKSALNGTWQSRTFVKAKVGVRKRRLRCFRRLSLSSLNTTRTIEYTRSCFYQSGTGQKVTRRSSPPQLRTIWEEERVTFFTSRSQQSSFARVRSPSTTECHRNESKEVSQLWRTPTARRLQT